ncbi:MAG: TetR/AcrR family transcriptional regulator [Myxococcales bacterium]|nr:TetR/AcrR family transcriptional regulator [Myxococcales bacterium]
MNHETPGLRAAQKAATREAVLEAARDEFESVGFDAASVRSIAKRAGVSAGTVLHHFGEKKELLYAALFDGLEATLDRALVKTGRPGALEKEASALGAAVFSYYQRRPSLSRTLLKESLFAEGPWASRFVAQVQRVHVALTTLVRESVAEGELLATVNADVVAAAWLSFFYFALIGWVQGAHPMPVALVEQLFAQHLAGLRSPTRPRSRR